MISDLAPLMIATILPAFFFLFAMIVYYSLQDKAVSSINRFSPMFWGHNSHYLV
jgi:hypothetical protein